MHVQDDIYNGTHFMQSRIEIFALVASRGCVWEIFWQTIDASDDSCIQRILEIPKR